VVLKFYLQDSKYICSCAVTLLAVLFVAIYYFLSYLFIGAIDDLIYSQVFFGISALVVIAFFGISYRDFVFSAHFWFLITVGLYIYGPIFVSYGSIDLYALSKVLLAVLVFLSGYIYILFLYLKPKKKDTKIEHTSQSLNPQAQRKLFCWLLISFLLVTLVKIYFFNKYLGEAGNALVYSQLMMNNGNSYLHELFSLQFLSYVCFLFVSYNCRCWKNSAIVLTSIILLEATYFSLRFPIILILLLNVYLYHRHIKSVKIITLVSILPFLLFILALMGITRDRGALDIYSYWDWVYVLINDMPLIVERFLHRLDVLPAVVDGFNAVNSGQIPINFGRSYFYELINFVPRGIWPDKPLYTAANLYAFTNPDSFRQGVTILSTIIYEGFWNLGWCGLFVMGSLLSFLAISYDELRKSNSIIKISIALTFFTFPMQLFLEGLHSNYVSLLIYKSALFIVWWKMFLILFRLDKSALTFHCGPNVVKEKQ
jgi:oligosaccharide repeat unit polymerase